VPSALVLVAPSDSALLSFLGGPRGEAGALALLQDPTLARKVAGREECSSRQVVLGSLVAGGASLRPGWRVAGPLPDLEAAGRGLRAGVVGRVVGAGGEDLARARRTIVQADPGLASRLLAALLGWVVERGGAGPLLLPPAAIARSLGPAPLAAPVKARPAPCLPTAAPAGAQGRLPLVEPAARGWVERPSPARPAGQEPARAGRRLPGVGRPVPGTA
jgi:hypothetical protein